MSLPPREKSAVLGRGGLDGMVCLSNWVLGGRGLAPFAAARARIAGESGSGVRVGVFALSRNAIEPFMRLAGGLASLICQCVFRKSASLV